MEYAKLIEYDNKDYEKNIMNDDFYRYVGWKQSEQDFDKVFFSIDTVNKISDRLKELLKCFL